MPQSISGEEGGGVGEVEKNGRGWSELWKISSEMWEWLGIQDLACQMLRILALEIEYLACQILKIDDLENNMEEVQDLGVANGKC